MTLTQYKISRIAVIGILLAIMPLSGFAEDVVLLSQNFDDTTLFDAANTVPRLIGDWNTIGGAWETFNTNSKGGPWVVNNGSNPSAVTTGPVYSGTQSLGSLI